jgi:hypothetical protein
LQKEFARVQSSCTSFYEEARDVVEQRRKNKTTNSLEYKREIQEFEALFGTDETHQIDWAVDWQEKLSNRWKNFHPTAVILNQNKI